MTLEAGTRSPEMTAAQDTYKRAIYNRFALLDPENPGLPSFFLERTVSRGASVPVIELSVRGDSLPPHLQALVDDIYKGARFVSFRIVAASSKLALIASNSDGTPSGSYPLSSEENGRQIYTGHEIAFDVDAGNYAVTKINGKRLSPYDAFLVDNSQVETQALEPEIVEDLASLIRRDSDGKNSKIVIYSSQHPDLPSSFRNGSPSL